MPIALSCDLMLLNEDGDVLFTYATETRYWDTPKGTLDPAENHRDTALRETREETGLVLDSHVLVELGRFPHCRDKEPHLFATRLRRAEVALDTLACTSMSNSYYSDRLIPEMDVHRWTTTDEMPQYASQSLMRLLAQTLTLISIDARLAKAGLQTNSA